MSANDLPRDRQGEANLPDVDRSGSKVGDAGGAGAGSGSTHEFPRDTGASVRVPLAEETLDIRVVQTQIGSLLIHKHIETQTLHDEVELHRQDVALEQLAMEELVDERREPWYEDGMLIIPVYEEVLVTEKKLMLTKLVRVQRKERIEKVMIDGDVRKEVLTYESKPVVD